MRRSLLLIVLLGLTYSAQFLHAQGWKKTFSIEDTTGTASYSLIRDVKATADGGYLLYGQAFSSNQLALWKIDTYGNTQWSKTFGAGAEAYGYASNMHLLGDSAIYISGRFSDADQLSPQHGVMRLNMQGEVQWLERYYVSDTLTTFSTAFTPTTDGHFITGSETLAGDSLLIHLHKIDQQGNVVWEKTYPRFSYWDEVLLPYVADITPLSSGGYIATGSYISMLGLQSSHIIRLDDNGEMLSQFNLMGVSDEIYTHRVKETTDGNYIVCGSSDGNFISPGFVKKLRLKVWKYGIGTALHRQLILNKHLLAIISLQEGSGSTPGVQIFSEALFIVSVKMGIAIGVFMTCPPLPLTDLLQLQREQMPVAWQQASITRKLTLSNWTA